ncbi:MAG TPA: Hpt domain-containing protein [Devosiaceae bacterium]|jgi:hypothetical protein
MARIIEAFAPIGKGASRSHRPIDLVHLAKQTLGDSGLEYEVLRTYEQYMQSTFAKLENSVTPAELIMHLHSLRGASSGVGAWGIADLAMIAEDEVRAGIVNPERIDDIDMAVHEVSAFIGELLATEAE